MAARERTAGRDLVYRYVDGVCPIHQHGCRVLAGRRITRSGGVIHGTGRGWVPGGTGCAAGNKDQADTKKCKCTKNTRFQKFSSPVYFRIILLFSLKKFTPDIHGLCSKIVE